LCERCGEQSNPNNPLVSRRALDYDTPIEVVHDCLVIHPDLMEFGKTYSIVYHGREYWIAKTDIGVISIWEVEDGNEYESTD